MKEWGISHGESLNGFLTWSTDRVLLDLACCDKVLLSEGGSMTDSLLQTPMSEAMRRTSSSAIGNDVGVRRGKESVERRLQQLKSVRGGIGKRMILP